ncbi:MAG TPA: FAD-dependent oxidoreductase [Anaerolineae bacterium]|nr:FAD-dependent oxidoreductase [Anaerolineae bacterium]
MAEIGTATHPLRVAIFGSGPAAFYAAEVLLKQANFVTQVDMFERLPPPYGLVRYGVAPDHPKIKTVTKVFDRIAASPHFRYFGWFGYSDDINLATLKEYYHQILFATGAPTDRRMNIPGEDLIGSHPATEFVAWYNGHPDFRNCEFDLSQERAAIVGVGNVALDVARMLCRSPAELAVTDVADYALEAFRESRIKEVFLLGRRGPAQAAFTNPEIKELGELEDTDVFVPPDEAELDPLSREEVEQSKDSFLKRKVEILQGYARNEPTGKPRRLWIRFLISPTELIGDATGRVVAMRLVKNILVKRPDGSLSAKPTDQFEELPIGLVFRSVGYRGLPLPDLPFDERGGVILNEKGRVLDPQTKQPLVGLYTSGWIKRGPTGVIGTNKPDSVQTVTCMFEDAANGLVLEPTHPQAKSIEEFVSKRQPNYFSWADWQQLDALEIARGLPQGRPRDKFTSIPEMLAALGRQP